MAVAGTLLRKSVTLYRVTRTTNGAGGSTESWAEYATVRGDYYLRQQRAGKAEAMEGDQPVDPTFIDAVLDATGTVPASEDAIVVQGRWFRIVSAQVQSPVVYVRAREVAPLA